MAGAQTSLVIAVSGQPEGHGLDQGEEVTVQSVGWNLGHEQVNWTRGG